MIPPELRFAACVIGALYFGVASGMALMALLSVDGREDRDREAFLRGLGEPLAWRLEDWIGGEWRSDSVFCTKDIAEFNAKPAQRRGSKARLIPLYDIAYHERRERGEDLDDPEVLRRLLGHPDRGRRYAALVSLRFGGAHEIGPETTLQDFHRAAVAAGYRRCLNDEDIKVRRLAAVVAGGIGDDEAANIAGQRLYNMLQPKRLVIEFGERAAQLSVGMLVAQQLIQQARDLLLVQAKLHRFRVVHRNQMLGFKRACVRVSPAEARVVSDVEQARGIACMELTGRTHRAG